MKENKFDGEMMNSYIIKKYIGKTIKMSEFYSPQRDDYQLILPFSISSHLISASSHPPMFSPIAL